MILIVLSVFMWNLCKCNCSLITEVILRNAQCNNKVDSNTGRFELEICVLPKFRKAIRRVAAVAQIKLKKSDGQF